MKYKLFRGGSPAPKQAGAKGEHSPRDIDHAILPWNMLETMENTASSTWWPFPVQFATTVSPGPAAEFVHDRSVHKEQIPEFTNGDPAGLISRHVICSPYPLYGVFRLGPLAAPPSIATPEMD